MSFIDRYETQLINAATAKRREHEARRRRWRMPAIGFGGVAAIGIAAAAIVLIPTGGLSPVEEARAALGAPDEIVHYKLRQTFVAADRSYPAQKCDFGETEVWQATSGTPRQRTRTPGPVGSDCGPLVTMPDETPTVGGYEKAYDGKTETYYVPALRRAVQMTIDPRDAPRSLDLSPDALAAPGAAGTSRDQQAVLRGLLAEPGLKDEGESEQGGRTVRTFTVPEAKIKDDIPGRPTDGFTRFVVDAGSFAPISVIRRYATSAAYKVGEKQPESPEFVTVEESLKFPVWERLPLNAQNQSLLQVAFDPGTSIARGSAKSFYQASRSVRLKRAREGKALVKAYEARQAAGQGRAR